MANVEEKSLDSKNWRQTVWTVVSSTLVAAVVSTVFTAFVGSYIANSFTERLENSKNAYAALFQRKSSFDNSQNSVYTELGLFTGSVLDGKKPFDPSKVEAAIVNTQLQLNELQVTLDVRNGLALDSYGDALADLKKSLHDVRSPADLGSVYVAARKMLVIHDMIDKEVAKKLKVRFT